MPSLTAKDADAGGDDAARVRGVRLRRPDGSHEDLDVFVLPTVPTLKQQHDTIATLAEHPRVRAVGETGLDHYRTREPEGWAVQDTLHPDRLVLGVDRDRPGRAGRRAPGRRSRRCRCRP